MMQQPSVDCSLCPRLCGFRTANRAALSSYHNSPVPSFGGLEARLLVVGLAPGLKGANRTGRPFTGDYAGDILYGALARHGFAAGAYDPERVFAEGRDGFGLLDCRITNAVRCVPPANKPEPAEIRNCNGFLKAEIAAMPQLRVILSLGQVSHGAVIRAVGFKPASYSFTHGGEHVLTQGGRTFILLSSYHTSRYNMNTGRLTVEMFDGVMARARVACGLPVVGEAVVEMA